MWETAAEEELQYFVNINDCIAQCAAEFGGGRTAYTDLPLLELLRWTNRAIKHQRERYELAASMRGI